MAGFLDGLISVFENVVEFTDDHPLITMLGVSAVAGALAPDELDIMKERQRIQNRRDEEDRRRRNENLQVGGINIGRSESKDFLESSGTPSTPYGIINSRINMGQR